MRRGPARRLWYLSRVGAMDESTIRVGISSCLLGNPVRFDGGHKLDRYLRDTLGAFVEWVPVCPEVECGLPVPREALRLVGDPGDPRLVTARTGVDHTPGMKAWAARRLDALEREDLCGFVFKSRSPSSGMRQVKVYPPGGGVPRPAGVGIFARAFMERFPLLPVEDEGRLNDPQLREGFIERLFVMARWKRYRRDDGTAGGLVAFHTEHKLLVMAHSPKHYAALGKLAAGAGAQGRRPPAALLDDYLAALLEGLRPVATAAKHANVLQHAAGYFKRLLSAEEKAELGEAIDSHRRGLLPLVVPVTLLAHYTRIYREPWLARQHYLHQHPRELMLRNHV
jgi:uncharacterized protein YbgA (DUF1722 family)/uncharacterized protein YbbK (DUF523 family)